MKRGLILLVVLAGVFMARFNLNGIWYTVKDGAAGDVAKYLKWAANDLQALKDRTPGLAVKHFRRPGMWFISSIFGRDEIRMEVEPAVAVTRKEKIKTVIPSVRYVPAFHTYDDAGNFLGLTLCISGKWGAPYKFIACSKDKILAFEDGLWNWDEGAERPDPDVYKLTQIDNHAEHPISYWDVPAVHEYCPGTALVGTDLESTQYWISGTSQTWLMCSQAEAHGYQYQIGAISEHSATNRAIIVWEDWASGEEIQPAIKNFSARYDKTGSFSRRGATASDWADNPEDDACANARAALGDANWDWEWAITKAYNYWQDGENLGWNVTTVWSGGTPYTSETWGTLEDITAESGCFFYGETYNTSALVEQALFYLTIPGFPNCEEAYRTSTLTEHYASADFISVFGKEYPLETLDGAYTSHGRRIFECFPRAYHVGSQKVCLASLYRMDRSKFEYLFFMGDTEQYNDPEAMYDYIDQDKHSLPITVNGAPAYGNGEFSLVRIDDPEFIKHEHEFEP